MEPRARPPAPPAAGSAPAAWTPAASWADALASAPSTSPDSAARAVDGEGRPLHLSARDATAAKVQSYRVRSSKKGGIPVAIEKRKCGKKVVLIAGVEGDVAALLSDLKRALGAGGVVTYPDPTRRDRGTAEIQGDRHLERVKEFLVLSGCVVGLSKKAKERALRAAAATKAKLQRKSKGVVRGGGAKPTRVKGKGCGGAGSRKAVRPIDPTVLLSNRAIKEMKPPALRAELAARGVSTVGNSKALAQRLKDAVAARDAAPPMEVEAKGASVEGDEA